MQEIKCPNCGEVFQVDESGYAQIVKQVRDKEFKTELEQRLKDLEEKQKSDISVAKLEQEQAYAVKLQKKETELLEKDSKIASLQAVIDNNMTASQLAVSEAVQKKEKENADLLAQKNDLIAEREKEILELKALLSNKDNEAQLAVMNAVKEKADAFEVERKESEKALQDKDLKILTLQNDLKNKDTERELMEKTLKEQHEIVLKGKDEQIEYYKDLKARQSTKMVGETLEQHCQIQFNQLRMTAFPNAYFEKDNDARSGSKGDFIFRDYEDGTEYISIMFEMKNEMDETATKHKNEDFFKELDKDRREKGCEYAVLVSLLEKDNELYNQGIVDVSYKYEKMYVIRPQLFIPMISLLRNAAKNSLEYQRELQVVKNQQIDILHFEENMNSFKEGFARNYRLASEKFKTAIDEIDKSITHLQKIKDALLSSENNLRLANNKADDLTIKKLTKNAPSVKEMFDELNSNQE